MTRICMKQPGIMIALLGLALAVAAPAMANGGKVWMDPGQSSGQPGSPLSTEIHLDTGGQTVAAHTIVVTFDANVVAVDTNQGTSGVEAGKDGFIAAVNAAESGKITISGFDMAGRGPGADLHLLTIHWTMFGAGETALDLSVKTLVNTSTEKIELSQVDGGSVAVSDGLAGANQGPLMVPDSPISTSEGAIAPPNVSSVPEPSTIALVGLGLVGALLAGRRRRKRR